MVIPFPAYRPTSWELQLPNYRVITNNWRATEAPEILGSLPEDARLRLRYEDITDQQALELLLLWRATAGSYYPLNALPALVASGINEAAMADRILDIAPLSWVVAEMPRQQSVKAGRSTVDIELKTELRLVPAIPTPAATCPVYAPRLRRGCVSSSSRLPESRLPEGVTVSGFFDPNGANRICITALSCAWYIVNFDSGWNIVPPLLGIDFEPGPNGSPSNCVIAPPGPFNVTIRGISGGGFPTRVASGVYTQDGQEIAFSLGRLSTGPWLDGDPLNNIQGYAAPATVAFTIEPVNESPIWTISAADMVYGVPAHPPDRSPSNQTYIWPGILSVNVTPPLFF